MARTPPSRESPAVAELDLDTQIALAERAIIVRDARIRSRTDALVRQARRSALKNAGGGVLLGVAAVGLAWWMNRRRPSAAAPAAAPEPEASTTFEHLLRDAALALAGMLPVLWPMLPRSLRRRVSPGTASTVLTFFAPLVGRLFRRRPRGSAGR
jgi:hypothetical protein